MKVNYINADDCKRIDGCWHIKGIPIDDGLLPDDEDGFIKEEWVSVKQYELIDALVKQLMIESTSAKNKLFKYGCIKNIDKEYKDYYDETSVLNEIVSVVKGDV